jgi:hypothetical protein
MGIIILVFTAQVKEIKYKYYPCEKNDYDCDYENTIININEDMKKPIMVYYQVDGVIQNHRFYMDSKSDKQLKGDTVSKEDLKKDKICESALTENQINNWWGYENNADGDLADPCGLISKTYFNDQFTEWELDGVALKEEELDEEKIAYQSDIDTYKGVANNKDYGEHFLVWMRISPFSNPRKLWGRINKDIKQNSKLKINIDLNYFGNRYIILSTRNIFGGKSMFLGICYIIAGGLSLMASVIFITTYSSFHRKN